MGGYHKLWAEIHPFDSNPLQHRQYGLPLSFWKPFQQRAENIQLLQCCSEISSVFLMLWIHAGKLGKYCQLFKRKNILDCCCSSHDTCCQGSICIPREVYDNTDNAGQGVASAIEFNNKENLLFPLFQNNPQTNLSTVISFSMNTSSEVQITDESSPIRISFNQV